MQDATTNESDERPGEHRPGAPAVPRQAGREDRGATARRWRYASAIHAARALGTGQPLT